MQLGCILMASGQSSRFKQNKLLSSFNNKPIIEHIFSELPTTLFSKVVVVTAFDEVRSLATPYGIPSILNTCGHLGVSHTIELGLDFIGDVDGCMFCVCDQPLCSKESFENLCDLFIKNPNHIIALGYKNRRGNPVIFPKSLFTELYSLSGDTGGRHVINQHLDCLEIVEAQALQELVDIDFECDLVALNHQLDHLS